jgi:uncharacterized protein YgbK (DUF1537 family)
MTGALETGAKFSASGAGAVVSAELTLDAGDRPVLVVDTETRHLAAADAKARIVRLARAARARGVPFLYKKTDSTLRGSWGAFRSRSAAARFAELPRWPTISTPLAS